MINNRPVTPTILLIDGSPSARRIVQGFLRRARFSVQSVATASAAWEEIAYSPPALILLDLLLPDQSGADFLHALRQDPRTATTPIILLTALASDQHIEAGLTHGADDYITKPADLHTIAARVREWLPAAA